MIVGWRSLGPHATGFLNRIPQVVTLHEFTTLDRFPPRFPSGLYHLGFADRDDHGLRGGTLPCAVSWRARQDLNRPNRQQRAVQSDAEAPRERRTVIYFGQIKPLKGSNSHRTRSRRRREGLPWDFQISARP